MKNEQLNNLVLKYRNDRCDETFAKIYETVSANWKGLEAIGKSVKADKSEVLALYQDCLLRCIDKWKPVGDFENFLKLSIRRRRAHLYRDNKRIYHNEVFITPAENEDGSEAATFEIADEFNLEDHITAKKKADQRQLIDYLLNGADETTTAIVETFLAHPKPTATAIAKELGYHHSKVTRALTRLASKFDSKKYGEYTDFLVAL